MPALTVNNKRSDCIFNIEAVEAKYAAKYVGEFCLKAKDGGWVNRAVSVFYQPKPVSPEYSHYFGLFYQDGAVLIADANIVATTSMVGIVAENGEVIYSAYRHDMTVSGDGSVEIDGGRDYVKYGGTGPLVLLKIVEDKIIPYLDMPAEVSAILKNSTC